MKKLLIILVLLGSTAGWALAQSDYADSLNTWDSYYVTLKINGYPVYDHSMNRYDFYDLDDNYRGSLCYNNMTEQWEYFGL